MRLVERVVMTISVVSVLWVEKRHFDLGRSSGWSGGGGFGGESEMAQDLVDRLGLGDKGDYLHRR